MNGNLAAYKCHKIVFAGKIIKIDSEAGTIEVLDYLGVPFTKSVEAAFFTRHKVVAGDTYFVQYEDGYESVSPLGAFEAGYANMADTIAAQSDPTDFKDRVRLEKIELDLKLNALGGMFNTQRFLDLDATAQDHLRVQHQHMHAYSEVLAIRIKSFN